MNKIVITNFYGFKNIGDGAILEAAIRLLKKSSPNSVVHIHTAVKFDQKKLDFKSTKVFLHPYGIAIRSNSNPLSDFKKITRFVKIIFISFFYTVLGGFSIKYLPKTGDYSYIRSLREANTVLGIGGGYLRTKNKIGDIFGLTLTLLPIAIAHFYGKRLLYLPMSYGDFASIIHKKIVFEIIKKDKIVFREGISMHEFTKQTKRNLDVHLIPDLALFDNSKIKKVNKENYIVLTARKWMSIKKQANYEKELARFIDYVWERYSLKTVFIPMVWNDKEEDDTRVALNIEKELKNKNALVIKSVSSTRETREIISKAKLSICTRMHSAILSANVGTPFITISYEYKTIGLIKLLNISEWNIDIRKLSSGELNEKFDKLYLKESVKFTQKIGNGKINIKKKEMELLNIMKDFIN